MHAITLLSTLLLALSTFPFSAAWPWPPTMVGLREVLGHGVSIPDILDPRDPLPLPLPAAASTTSTAAATTKSEKNEAAKTGSAAKTTGGAAKTTGAAKSGASASGTSTSAAASVPQDAPAGGFSMVTPAQTMPTYAKIGSPVTFVWNYTSILVAPSAVDVVATNSDGAWTIASNISAKETSVVWDTANEATPLPMESYTLVIYDAAAGPTAMPKPGHLSPYIGYQFAMYMPQKYQPSDEYFCVPCSAATASLPRQSFAVVLGTAAVTVLAATWFTAGLVF